VKGWIFSQGLGLGVEQEKSIDVRGIRIKHNNNLLLSIVILYYILV
jgi:hypothetical protein|tara:strand:+ start:2221 stop:2358 length:138 start_codon:yes stop_codon:yes gene_type:complete